MAWIFINTTQPGASVLGILRAPKPKLVHVQGASHRVLVEIARSISAESIRAADGICVVHGPGSFTSVRTGVLIANLLSRLFRKPLVGVSTEEAADLSALTASLSSGSLCALDYVQPTYDAEPNITMSARKPFHP